jgi:Major Facilitator Superfamily
MSPAPAPASGSISESAPAGAPGASPENRHPFFLRHFRNLWFGSSISLLGDQLYLVALPFLVLQLTGSSLALGTIMMTATIPRTVLMVVGGAVTDRVSPRRVLIMTAMSRAVFVGTVATVAWLGLIELWQLYVLTFLFGVADAFSFPAGGTLIPSLVAPQQLARANAMFQSSVMLIQMIGQAPAGWAIERWGIAAALFFDAASFLAVIVALLKVPDPPRAAPAAGAQARQGILSSIGEGWRAVWNDRPLTSLMVVFATVNLCVIGPTGVGLASLANFQFSSPAVYGIFLACFSGGTLAGVLAGGMVKRPRRRGLVFIALSTLTGLALLAIGLLTGRAAIGASLALMGSCVGFVNVHFSSWVQTRVERALLGRVFSVLMVLTLGLAPLSFAISGALAQWNVKGLFIVAGAVLATVGFVMALTSRAAREID